MLHTKAIDKITYQDIIDFCNQQIKESIHLDYKQEIDGSLVKTIAAMANTWGGLIIIGVEDEDSMPKLPVAGLTFREHLQEQINNLILGNITLPIFPEIGVYKSEDGVHAFVIVRVSQSNMTPHAIKGNTKVYLRTNTSNEPEELANIDRVLWLTERRKKSIELKEGFYKRANERFSKLCNQEGISVDLLEATFSICPLYPFEILVNYRELTREGLDKISTRGYGGESFPIHLQYGQYEPAEGGTFSVIARKETRYISYEDINHYGFFYHREDLCRSAKNEQGVIIHHGYLLDICRHIDLFIESMGKFYNYLGYWGTVELIISLNKLSGVDFSNLPPPRNHYRLHDEPGHSVDDSLKLTKEVSVGDLREKRVDILVNLMTRISWSLGFPHNKEETIKKLLEEAGRI